MADGLRRLTGAFRPSPGVVLYLACALTLTALTAALHWWVIPRTGLVRTFYGQPDFQGEPLLEQITDDVSLAFLDTHPGLPRRSFSIRWRGYWFLHEAETIEIHAAANDRVDIEIDSRVVLSRNARVGMNTTGQSVSLAAGVHEIVISYQQDRGRRRLNVQWTSPGARRGEMPRGYFLPERPGPRDVTLATVSLWMTRLTASAWLLPPIALFVITAVRSASRLVQNGRSATARPMLEELRRRLALVATPALLAPVVLFLLGPYTIYHGNRGEFAAGIADAWPWLVGAVALGWALLFGLGCMAAFVSTRLTRIYSAVLVVLGVLAWIQGNVLLADYGALRGEELDLSVHAGRAPYELALWIAGAAVAVMFAGPISAVAARASWLFIAFQMATLGIAALGAATFDSATADRHDEPAQSGMPERIAHLSRSRNVIHLVLDAFPSELFAEALETDRATFDRDFPGFVFFADHLGAFPTTRASMPAMLTGVAYRNEIPFIDLLRRGDRTIFSALAGHGYSVRSVTFHNEDHPRLSRSATEDIVRYTIRTPYGSYSDQVRSTALQLVDLSLFRHAPHSLKGRVYNEQAWLAEDYYARRSLRSEQARRVRTSGNAIFLDELSSRLTIATDAPVYTFLHVGIPHPPIVVDSDCSFIGYARLRRETYLAQSQCALAIVGRLLDRLRSLDIYDRTAVVVTADHGWRIGGREHPLAGVPTPAGGLDRIVSMATPLLAVKPFDSSGPVRVSTAPTSITDIPATIADLAQVPGGLFPGESVLRIPEDARRPRTYAVHPWGKAGDWSRSYFEVLHLFTVDGRVFNADSWSLQKALFEPGGDTRAVARGPVGLYQAERDAHGAFRWGAPYVVTYAPSDARTLAFDVRRAPQRGSLQTVTLRIDGRVAARHELLDDAWHSYRHELGPRGATGPFTIELLAAPASHDERGRELGVMYRNLEWTR